VPKDPINYAGQYNWTTYGDVFLKGLEADTFAQNTSNCYNRFIYFYYYEIPLIQIRYYYGDTHDNFFNTTELISNLSNHLMVCNDAALNWYKYGLAEKVIFPTSSDYFLAFFQNLLANILNINYIY
jgi:hypothetical protein